MEVLTIEMEAVKELLKKIDTIYMYVINSHLNKEGETTRWLNSEEVCELLRISNRTLQRLRKSRKIQFTTFNRRCIYKMDDIEKLVSHHAINCDQNYFEKHKKEYLEPKSGKR